LAAGALAVVIVVIVILCQPVYERTSLTVEMQQAHFSRQWETVSQLATQAAQADTLDPLAAADAAKAWGLNLRQRPDSASHAYDWAKEAVRRDGQSASWWQLAAAVAMKLGRAKESLSHMEQAVKLDPRDLRLRLGYARMLIAASRGADALQELDAVEKTDKGLLPDSTERLSDAERREIAQLRKLAGGKP
jgi:predicted Zn-dependent protease